jgi:methyl-accepting chemotaxis protein
MGLGLVAKISEHEAFRPVSRIRIVIIVAMTCILIVGIFASLVLAKLVTAPIIELGKTAAAIGGGDMTARVNIGRVIFRDEIDDLRLIFNSMVEEIAASHDAMEQKASPLKDLFLDLSVLCMFAVSGPLISKFCCCCFCFHALLFLPLV